MDAGNWKKVKSILEKALDVPPEKRGALLDVHCNGDGGLRDEVLEFLAAEESADLLEVSAVESVFEPDRALDGSSYIGSILGTYRILRPIGSGGMGAVFLAERSDGQFSQTVAIKLIKAGFDSEAVHQRFLNERQILASLEHPNIARLIDGGSTDDGSPYLVMEYVEGLAINEYADQQGLGLEQRLDLFREVCAAVAFAHRSLVIHRDLKPTNILVTSDGKPKLLDFGIAKLVDPDADAEAVTRQFAFTPEYASPEQILGENLTTSTDIYSLGIILFELLTGRRPFLRDGSVGDIIRSTSQGPTRPSSLAREASGRPSKVEICGRLRGDLDNIILKALKSEPERRYASVDQFSEDIRRHLKGLPVLARPDTVAYRAQKFVRRNPLIVASAAVTLIILLAGVFATTYQARRADRERAKAEQRFNEVRSLANSFIFEVNDKIDESPIKAREFVVTRALEYLDRLAAESSGDAGLQVELAAAYEKIGDLQAELFQPNLGDAGAALESQRKALSLRQTLYEADMADTARVIDLARSHQKVAGILMVTGDIAAAAATYRDGIALTSGVDATGPAGLTARRQLRSLYLSLGQAILRSGSLSECLENYQRAFEINETLLQHDPDPTDPVRAKFIILNYLGYVRLVMGENDKALDDLTRSLDLARRLQDAAPNDRRAERSMVSAFLFLGIGQRESGNIGDALISLGEALRRQDRVYQLDPQNLGERNSLADCYLEIGAAQAKAGRTSPALRHLRSAMEHYAAVSEKSPKDLAVRRQMVLVRLWMAEAESSAGRYDSALAVLSAAEAEATELVRLDPNNLEWKYDLARTDLAAAQILRREGSAAAVEHKETARQMLEALAAVSPQNAEFARDLTAARAL